MCKSKQNFEKRGDENMTKICQILKHRNIYTKQIEIGMLTQISKQSSTTPHEPTPKRNVPNANPTKQHEFHTRPTRECDSAQKKTQHLK